MLLLTHFRNDRRNALFLLNTHALDSLDKETDLKYTQKIVHSGTAFRGEHYHMFVTEGEAHVFKSRDIVF